MAQPMKSTPAKQCAHCGAPMLRVRWANGKIESQALFERRKYCGRSCWHSASIGGERP